MNPIPVGEAALYNAANIAALSRLLISMFTMDFLHIFSCFTTSAASVCILNTQDEEPVHTDSLIGLASHLVFNLLVKVLRSKYLTLRNKYTLA